MAKVKCHIIPGREHDGGFNLEEVVAIRGETGGYLNPRWIEWLMGFPPGWCVPRSTPSATPWSPPVAELIGAALIDDGDDAH